MLKIAIAAAAGKMGLSLATAANADKDIEVGVGTYNSTKPNVNFPLKRIDELTSNDFDVLIDFSTRDSTLMHLDKCLELKKPIIICTTGFNSTEDGIISEASKKIPVLKASNTSLGVALLQKAIVNIAKTIPSSWEISIDETHHVHKVDNPSGTALTLASAVGAESVREVPCVGYREGEVFGIHNIRVKGPKEELTFTHKANDRGLFADGALYAAKWLFNKKVGFYSMEDVLL